MMFYCASRLAVLRGQYDVDAMLVVHLLCRGNVLPLSFIFAASTKPVGMNIEAKESVNGRNGTYSMIIVFWNESAFRL